MGLIVGLVLLIAQWYRENHAATTEARDGPARLIHPLLLELQRAGDDPRYERLDKLSRRRQAALALIEQTDVEVWHVRRPTKLTMYMLAYRSACWSLIAQGKELESGVRRWCRDHATSPRTLEFAIAKLKGANHRDLRKQFTATDWPNLTSDYLLLVDSPRVKKPARRFRGKSKRALRRENELRDLLVEIMHQRRGRSTWERSPKATH